MFIYIILLYYYIYHIQSIFDNLLFLILLLLFISPFFHFSSKKLPQISKTATNHVAKRASNAVSTAIIPIIVTYCYLLFISTYCHIIFNFIIHYYYNFFYFV